MRILVGMSVSGVPVLELPVESSSCQRWTAGRHSFVRRRDGGFDARRYEVEPVDEAVAKAFVVEHHYSRSFPAAVHRFGLFDVASSVRVLVGVAVFSVPPSSKVLSNVFPSLEPYVQSLELGRFVLLGEPGGSGVLASGVPCPPANAESWFLARCFEGLSARGVLGVVSFADPVPRRVGSSLVFPGHVGVVYQACNAVFTGRSTPRSLVVLPDGSSLSERALQKVRAGERGHEYVERRLVGFGAPVPAPGVDMSAWLSGALDAAGATRLRHRGNLRYAFVTARRARGRVPVLGGPLAYVKSVDAA